MILLIVLRNVKKKATILWWLVSFLIFVNGAGITHVKIQGRFHSQTAIKMAKRSELDVKISAKQLKNYKRTFTLKTKQQGTDNLDDMAGDK